MLPPELKNNGVFGVSGIPEKALIWKLKSVNAINSAVSGNIFPRNKPEKSTASKYLIVDRTPGQTNPQLANGPSSLIKTPMTIYCYAPDYDTSRVIARLIKPAINPASVTGSVQWNGTWIDHVTVVQTYEASEPPRAGDEVGYPCEAIDIVMHHFDCDSSG